MKKALVTVIVAAILAGVGYGGWKVWGDSNNSESQQNTNSQAAFTIPDDWVWYENKELKIRFAYPENWGEVSVVQEVSREKVILGYFGSFASNKSTIFRLYVKDVDGTDREGVSSSLHYKDWCVNTKDKIQPIMSYGSACSDVNAESEDFASPELISGSSKEAIIFDSKEVYSFAEPPNDNTKTIGLIVRLSSSSTYPTITLSSPYQYKEDVRSLARTIE